MEDSKELDLAELSDTEIGGPNGGMDPDVSPWASIKVLAENPDYLGQKTNEVRTTRYTILTFLPLTLWENFRILSNVYFLIVLIVTFLPWSPVDYMFQLLPLVFVILVSMAKAAVEDIMKAKEDRIRNRQPVKVFRDGIWQDIISRDVRVGDVIKITEDGMVPSDLLYIGSTEESKLCYFSETNLNGETAVKTMSCFPAFENCDAVEELLRNQYVVDVGEPDRDLTRFDARVNCPGTGKFWPVSIHNVLLRGVCTHYTENVIGIVLRTGHDSKIMRNMKHPPAKLTSFDIYLNRLLIGIFVVNMIICLISAGVGIYQEDHSRFVLIKELVPEKGLSYGQFFVQYFILYSYLIPISLTVTIELLRLFHKLLMDWDPEIYDPEFGNACAHNSNQIGQLGLVTHILSDKTGTLTENIMEMLKFSTDAGKFDAVDFVQSITSDGSLVRQNIEFLMALALCNNVIVHRKADGALEYNADSPDEQAFVQFAASCGVKLVARGLTSMSIDIKGVEKRYEILAQLPFNSDRKRMSILLQAEGEPAVLYCKGADNIIRELAVEFTYTDVVNEYAATGLRTLVFTKKVLGDEELNHWLTAFREAEASLADRDAKIEQRAAEMENRLEVIGVSGVEDRLQPQVPETIDWLRRAGIKVWILTGDKLETAIAIGRTSGIIQPQCDVLIISNDDRATVKRRLAVISDDLEGFTMPVLIVTAAAVEYCLNDFFDDFMALSARMTAVILSRVSPFMKAQVTSAVRERGGMTLAIGDGANDVGMIQVAHVGVGVYGREGSQAAQSSDFAIPRFRHLVRLLSVHGHWSYNRFSTVAMIMLYKNFTFILNQLWFSFDNLWSPSSLFADFFLSIYNLVYTVLPPFAFGCCEQDLPQEILMANPELYQVTKDPMRGKYLAYCVCLAIYQSLVSYWSTKWNMGQDSLVSAGIVCYHTVVYIVIVQVILWSHNHNVIGFVFYGINIIGVPIMSVVYIGLFDDTLQSVLEGPLSYAYPWLGMIVAVVVAVLPDFIIQNTVEVFQPSRKRLFAEKVYKESKANSRSKKSWAKRTNQEHYGKSHRMSEEGFPQPVTLN